MKHLSLALLIFLLVITLVSCTGTSAPTPPADVTTEVPETEAPIVPIDLIKDGVANYTVIRGEEADSNTVQKTTLLMQNLAKYTGVSPMISTDWIRKGEEHDPNTLEILVGNTNYKESAEALEGLPYGNYVVKKVGNKLVINAWSSKALNRAITLLITDITKNATEGNYSLPGDILLTGAEQEELNLVPYYEGAQLETVYPSGNNNQLLLFSDTDMAEFNTYLGEIEKKGFTLYTDNEVVGNKFATYINDEYVVTAGYYKHNNEARVIIEPRTTLPILAEENKYEKVTEPKFALLGLEYDSGEGYNSQNGQCFVWQLSDGSFIVVDGGFNRSVDARQILKFMQENAPDPKNINIAAWIITHAHGDHYGAFANFSANYGKHINLELIIANFLSDEAREMDDMAEGGGYVYVLQHEKSYPNCQYLEAHTGQKLHIRDAEIEILYTIESYVPRSLDNYFNTTSLVFTVDIAGQRFLVTGDAGNDACAIIAGMYGDYLKSDYVQAAHHGYQVSIPNNNVAGVKKVYELAAAPVVLWPVGEKDFVTMINRPQSKYLQDLPTTKEIFVAGANKITLNLPYTVGTSGQKSVLK